eukprot:3572283-Pyramimonas_sp.AAC.1
MDPPRFGVSRDEAAETTGHLFYIPCHHEASAGFCHRPPKQVRPVIASSGACMLGGARVARASGAHASW